MSAITDREESPFSAGLTALFLKLSILPWNKAIFRGDPVLLFLSHEMSRRALGVRAASILMAVVTVLIASCSRKSDMRELLSDFMSEKLAFPDSMLTVTLGKVSDKPVRGNHFLVETRYAFPVHVDVFGELAALNRQIPPLRNCHTFPLNDDSYPIFVGDPLFRM